MMASSSDLSADASRLISELEQLAEEEKGTSLPSANQFYVIGGVLFRAFEGKQHDEFDLRSSYQHLIDSIPDSYWQQTFQTYFTATKLVLEESSQNHLETLIDATEALLGMLCNSAHLCQIAYSKEWMSLLASIYDRFILNDALQGHKETVLSSASFLLLDGLFLRKDSQNQIEEQILETIRSIEEQSTDFLSDLQEWQSQSEPFRRTLENTIKKLPAPKDDDDDSIQQREYILNMLESARQHEPTQAATVSPGNWNKLSSTTKPSTPKPVSAADEFERRIQQVKQILPDLGEGFIESALSLYQGNVETTVSILLNDPSQYPTSLRVLDKSLPRRRKERSNEEAEESAQARQIVKERIALEEQQEQQRYKALLYVESQQRDPTMEQEMGRRDEYDDDYDDQYDDADAKIGGADDGLYDFEQVKIYNQVARAQEAEGSFWEENRNTNRETKKGSIGKNSEDQEKQYRGPDKIKGGRIIGPDGKIVKKQGRGKKNGKNVGGSGSQSLKPQDLKTKEVGSNSNPNAQQKQGDKPRTKPKSKNRINRQRDRKQKNQGVFGNQG